MARPAITTTPGPSAARPASRKPAAPRLAVRLNGVLWGLGSAVLGLVVFQLAVSAEILPSRYFPTVPQVASALFDEVQRSEYWLTVWETVRDAGAGLLVAIAVAVPLGIALGLNDFVYHLTRFVVEFLRPIPVVAIIPLFVLVTGTGSTTKFVLAAFSAVFPILLQTIYGVRDVDPIALETAAAFQIGGPRRLFRVIVPSALTFVVTGIRISGAIAVLVTISTEIIVGAPGIGREITLAESGGVIPKMYAFIVTAGVLGMLLNSVLTGLENRTHAWSPGQGTEDGA